MFTLDDVSIREKWFRMLHKVDKCFKPVGIELKGGENDSGDFENENISDQ